MENNASSALQVLSLAFILNLGTPPLMLYDLGSGAVKAQSLRVGGPPLAPRTPLQKRGHLAGTGRGFQPGIWTGPGIVSS